MAKQNMTFDFFEISVVMKLRMKLDADRSLSFTWQPDQHTSRKQSASMPQQSNSLIAKTTDT